MEEYNFTLAEAVAICEQTVMSDIEEETAAWQYLIDTGAAWKLQGWFGRTAKRLIDEGVCDRFIPSADPYRAAYYKEDELV